LRLRNLDATHQRASFELGAGVGRLPHDILLADLLVHLGQLVLSLQQQLVGLVLFGLFSGNFDSVLSEVVPDDFVNCEPTGSLLLVQSLTRIGPALGLGGDLLQLLHYLVGPHFRDAGCFVDLVWLQDRRLQS
jgi:hypothetical protein